MAIRQGQNNMLVSAARVYKVLLTALYDQQLWATGTLSSLGDLRANSAETPSNKRSNSALDRVELCKLTRPGYCVILKYLFFQYCGYLLCPPPEPVVRPGRAIPANGY